MTDTINNKAAEQLAAIIDRIERQEEQALLHTYLDALSSFEHTPLGKAAKRRDRVAEAYA